MNLGQRLAQPLGDAPLVGRFQIGEQQADRDRGDSGIADSRRQGVELGVVEGLDHTVGPDPLGDLELVLGGNQWDGLWRAEAVELGTVLAADAQQVAEAASRHQCGACTALLQQRVGPHRHAVGEALDLVWLSVRAPQGRVDGSHHAARLVLRRGRDLGGVEALAVEDDGVGEGASYVNPEQHAPTLPEVRRDGELQERLAQVVLAVTGPAASQPRVLHDYD